MRTSYSPLYPAALAVAGGAGTLVLALLTGFGMMGAGSMMGGSMMGGYPGYHMTVGGGLFMLFWAFVTGALAGWIVALVYNAVVRQASDASDTTTGASAR